MVLQNSLFPSLLVIILITNASALSPVSNCLGHCATCEPNNLTYCKGASPCEWGFFDSKNIGNCELLPTLRLLSSELGERTDKNMKISSESWGDDAKYSTCEYSFQGKKKIIDILGPFDGTSTISKAFTVTPDQQIYEFSFNLFRDEWLPFNDFLIIDISSEDQPIQSIEISYETRKKVESQSTIITCSGKRFMNEKYNIKVLNPNKQISNQLTFVFSSFLYSSNWGVSNVKIIEGCAAFSKLDGKSETCSSCDSGSYLLQNAQGALWCQKCPVLCSTCISEKVCTACVNGAKLIAGLCSFSEDYKVQNIAIPTNGPQCGANSFLLGSLGTAVVLPQVSNDNDHLYDEIQMGFELLYSPSQWNAQTSEQISVKINKIEILSLTYKNLTNTATDTCTFFKGGKVSSIRIISSSIIQVSNHLNIEFQLMGKSNISFGVRGVFVKSLLKYEQPKKIAAAPKIEDTKPIVTIKTPSIIPQVNKNNGTQNVTLILTPLSETPSLAASYSPSNNEIQPSQLKSNTQASDPLGFSTQAKQQNPLSFIPILSQSNSGLQLTISNVTEIKGYLTVIIDKLPPNSYELDSFYIDDSILHAFIIISQSFTDAELSVYEQSTATTSRILQGTLNSTLIAQGGIPRFDHISKDQSSSITSFSVFFSVFAWFGVIAIILAVMIGYGVAIEQYIISLQVLFLHLYISTEILPLSFREAIAGLRIIENLNFFVPYQAKSIEGSWMGNVVQNGPVRLSLYNTDINFSREFYPILVINIIYFLWFCLLFIAKKYLLKSLPGFQEKGKLNRIIENITKRVINFTDQIWRYQFLATVWFCFLQFHNFVYPSHSNRSQTMNAIFCISCFVCTLAWPIIIGYYSRKQYYENEYSEFIYKFQDIFFMKIPQFYLPTSHHRVGYPMFRIGKCFIIPFIIACFDNPAFVLLILITIHSTEIIYTQNYDIFSDHKYSKMKLVQNALFCAIEVLMVILYGIQNVADAQTYISLGFILSVLGVLVVLNASIRAGFLGFKKYKELTGVLFEEMVDPDVNKLKTERVV